MLGGWNFREIPQTLSGLVVKLLIGLVTHLEIW
jgi:hypothetical protein